MTAIAGVWIIPGRPAAKEFARKTAWKTVLFVVFQCVFLVCTDDVPLVFWFPCMMVAFFSMLLYRKWNSSHRWMTALYYSLIDFLMAELLASLEWQIEFFFLGFAREWIPVRILFVLIIYTAQIIFFYGGVKRIYFFQGGWEVKGQDVATVFGIVIAAFAMGNLSFLFPNTPFTTSEHRDIFIIRTLADVVGLSVLFAYQSRVNSLYAQHELIRMKALIAAQYEQYRNFQSGIELINIKYHDLKHQIVGLRGEADPEKREAWIRRMEEELQEFRPEQQTGNPVLDTLLMGKSMDFRKDQIKFTCVVDGEPLRELFVTDICSIFGNALDNAIEAVSLLEDPAKRMIHLTVTEKNGFLLIMLVNACGEQPQVKRGIPITTKKDSSQHGYGMRSIQLTAEKYGGTVTWAVKNEMFELKVLIPLKGR